MTYKEEKNTPIQNTTRTGKQYEQEAEQYLCKHGLKTIARNWRVSCGEIDLIMQDQDTTVFIEVKYRKSDHWGSPLDQVTRAKQTKLVRAAQLYLNKQDQQRRKTYRFDVVGICGLTPNLKIQWVKNAF
ncbi:MAG: YraN family protein [Pseudomonadales bacterium]